MAKRKSSPEGTSRPQRQLLVDSLFGPFFWGRLFSTAGLWVHNMVAAIIAFQISGSALIVGMVSVAQFAPQLLLAPLSGKSADRGSLRKQIFLGRLLVGLGSSVLATALVLVSEATALNSASIVILASFTVGLGQVVSGPPTQAILPSLVRPGELGTAIALNSVPMTVARAAGPALGASITAATGPEYALFGASMANFGFALVVLRIRIPKPHPPPSGSDLSVRYSVSHIRRDRPLSVLLMGIAILGSTAEPSVTLAPALAQDLAGDPGLAGWLTSSFGIGAAIGISLLGTVLRSTEPPRTISVGLAVMATMLLMLSLRIEFIAAIAVLLLMGLGFALSFTCITTQIQDRSPDLLRGRIMALWFLGFLGARPFAAAFTGAVADFASVQVAFLLMGILGLGAVWLCRPANLRGGLVR